LAKALSGSSTVAVIVRRRHEPAHRLSTSSHGRTPGFPVRAAKCPLHQSAGA
jgi:hypothetical protein